MGAMIPCATPISGAALRATRLLEYPVCWPVRPSEASPAASEAFKGTLVACSPGPRPCRRVRISQVRREHHVRGTGATRPGPHRGDEGGEQVGQPALLLPGHHGQFSLAHRPDGRGGHGLGLAVARTPWRELPVRSRPMRGGSNRIHPPSPTSTWRTASRFKAGTARDVDLPSEMAPTPISMPPDPYARRQCPCSFTVPGYSSRYSARFGAGLL